MLHYLLSRSAPYYSNVIRHDERRENIAQALYEVGAQFAAVVVFDEPQKAAMLDAPDYHRWRWNVR